MITPAQVVKISITTTDNSPSQDYTHVDDQTVISYITSGFKPLIDLAMLNEKNFLFPSIGAFMNNLVSRVMLSNRRMFSVWLQNDTSQQNLAAEFWEVEDNSLISFIRLLILVLITFGFIAV